METETGRKFEHLIETKNQIKNALIDQGQEVLDTDTFRSYVDKIKNISGGSTWTEDELNPDLAWGRQVYDENNLEGYPYKLLELIFADTTQSTLTLTGHSVLKTSDGATYENPEYNNLTITHYWNDDNAKNATYYKGEKLRWIILFNSKNYDELAIRLPNLIYFCSNCKVNISGKPTLITFDFVDEGKLSSSSSNQTIAGASLERIPTFQRNVSSSLLQYGVSFSGSPNLKSVKIDYDTSVVTLINNPFRDCSSLRQNPYFNTSNVTNFSYWFSKCTSLRKYQTLDTKSSTTFSNMFENCKTIETIEMGDTSNGTSFSSFAYYCENLRTLKNLDLIKATNVSSMLSYCYKLENLDVRNIAISLQIGSGTYWGHLLTVESLTNTIKELWDMTSSSTKTLTMGTANLQKLANVYVKLIDVTDEMRTEDPYIDNKKPFVVCESTDEGAMLITEYVTSKNWQLA